MVYIRFLCGDLGHIPEHHPQFFNRIRVQNSHRRTVISSGNLGGEHCEHIGPGRWAALDFHPVVGPASLEV